MASTLTRVAAVAFVLAGCQSNDIDESRAAPTAAREMRGEPITLLEAPADLDSRKVSLGRRLFHDTALSRDGSKSCASCHDLANGGDDGLPTAIGILEQRGSINAPTVYNAGFNIAQFWDGRAGTLEEQMGGPLTAPAELGSTWPDVLARLSADPRYAAQFDEIYGDGVKEPNVRDAVATFERSLVTTGSRFDAWLSGDDSALSDQEKAGYELFKNVGCVACHQGRNAGGNMYERLGVLGDYFQDRGNKTDADNGRFNVTGLEEDRHVFRVPSLRYAAHTAPYFHDGSAATLEDAVAVMARYQLGRRLSKEDVAKIVAFLQTLAGPVPETAKQEGDS